MRALRNLNSRYEADSWLPAGATLNATTEIVGLYNRHCVRGKRAELARALVTSDPNSAIVRNAVAPSAIAALGAGATTPAVATATAPREYRVQGGETLTSIARKFQCSVRELAQANDIKAPRYRIRPGQALKLEGCGG